jgi:hypothetical protein
MIRLMVDKLKEGPNKGKLASYHNITLDEYKFADATMFRPVPFDLCHLKTDKEKTYIGWWTGQEYFGTRLPENSTIIAWKRSTDQL